MNAIEFRCPVHGAIEVHVRYGQIAEPPHECYLVTDAGARCGRHLVAWVTG